MDSINNLIKDYKKIYLVANNPDINKKLFKIIQPTD